MEWREKSKLETKNLYLHLPDVINSKLAGGLMKLSRGLEFITATDPADRLPNLLYYLVCPPSHQFCLLFAVWG